LVVQSLTCRDLPLRTAGPTKNPDAYRNDPREGSGGHAASAGAAAGCHGWASGRLRPLPDALCTRSGELDARSIPRGDRRGPIGRRVDSAPLSVSRPSSQVRAITDPKPRWRSEQRRDRVEPWRVPGSQGSEPLIGLFEWPGCVTVFLHRLEDVTELFHRDHG